MKKSYKPLILVILLLLISITAIILVSVAIRLKYEEATRLKVILENDLKIESTLKIRLLADYQKFSDKNIIETYALENLGMIKNDKPLIKLILSQADIDKINEEVKKKYE